MNDPTPSFDTRIHADVLLVTELFPPAVGGSAVLYENTYGHLEGARLRVLTDAEVSPGPTDGPQGPFEVSRRTIKTRQWGFTDVRGNAHHLRDAARIRWMARRRHTVVHTGRALPEGIAAMLSRIAGGPRYCVWAHGEDVSTALTSRELTLTTKAVFQTAAAVFANSANTARLLESIGIPRRRVHVVYPGVDPDQFHPGVDGSRFRKKYAPNGETLLLSVGRLQRRKGQDTGIEAIAKLEGKRDDLRYLILSEGEERPRLEQLIRELGVGDRVTLAGAVPFTDLPAYYAACDIFMMPNRVDGADIEGFGIVFVEAQATERPVIGGRSGGVPEAVAEGEVGLLVEGGDADELAASIDMLAGHDELRRRMGQNGRARVLDNFTWVRAAEKVARVHNQVAAERRFP